MAKFSCEIKKLLVLGADPSFFLKKRSFCSFVNNDNFESIIMNVVKGDDILSEIKSVKENYADDIKYGCFLLQLEIRKVLMKGKKIESSSDMRDEVRDLAPNRRAMISKICKLFTSIQHCSYRGKIISQLHGESKLSASKDESMLR